MGHTDNYKLAKELLNRVMSSGNFRAQLGGEWSGDFALPAEVQRYYLEFGPENVNVPSYGNPYFLPSLSRLWEHQRGYRIHGISGERLADWRDTWLVIADQGGDPFIFDSLDDKVLHAFHGEGRWESTVLLESLDAMALVLAILGDIVLTAGADFTDSKSLIRAKYLEEARMRIGEVVRSDDSAQAVLTRLWLK